MEDFLLVEKLLKFEKPDDSVLTEEQYVELQEEYEQLRKIHIDEIPLIYNLREEYEELATC